MNGIGGVLFWPTDSLPDGQKKQPDADLREIFPLSVEEVAAFRASSEARTPWIDGRTRRRTTSRDSSITPAAGGTISDGFYRTAYGEDTTLTSNGTEALEAYVFSGNQYIHLGEGNSEVGTYTTSGDTITFTPTSECDSATGAADTGTPEPSSQEHFTFANGSFALYYAASSTDTELTMYAPVDAFCDLPQSPATSPSGDTAFCDVTNCGCTENTNAPADAQTCQTVSGH